MPPPSFGQAHPHVPRTEQSTTNAAPTGDPARFRDPSADQPQHPEAAGLDGWASSGRFSSEYDWFRDPDLPQPPGASPTGSGHPPGAPGPLASPQDAPASPPGPVSPQSPGTDDAQPITAESLSSQNPEETQRVRRPSESAQTPPSAAPGPGSPAPLGAPPATYRPQDTSPSPAGTAPGFIEQAQPATNAPGPVMAPWPAQGFLPPPAEQQPQGPAGEMHAWPAPVVPPPEAPAAAPPPTGPWFPPPAVSYRSQDTVPAAPGGDPSPTMWRSPQDASSPPQDAAPASQAPWQPPQDALSAPQPSWRPPQDAAPAPQNGWVPPEPTASAPQQPWTPAPQGLVPPPPWTPPQNPASAPQNRWAAPPAGPGLQTPQDAVSAPQQPWQAPQDPSPTQYHPWPAPQNPRERSEETGPQERHHVNIPVWPPSPDAGPSEQSGPTAVQPHDAPAGDEPGRRPTPTGETTPGEGTIPHPPTSSQSPEQDPAPHPAPPVPAPAPAPVVPAPSPPPVPAPAVPAPRPPTPATAPGPETPPVEGASRSEPSTASDGGGAPSVPRPQSGPAPQTGASLPPPPPPGTPLPPAPVTLPHLAGPASPPDERPSPAGPPPYSSSAPAPKEGANPAADTKAHAGKPTPGTPLPPAPMTSEAFPGRNPEAGAASGPADPRGSSTPGDSPNPPAQAPGTALLPARAPGTPLPPAPRSLESMESSPFGVQPAPGPSSPSTPGGPFGGERPASGPPAERPAAGPVPERPPFVTPEAAAAAEQGSAAKPAAPGKGKKVVLVAGIAVAVAAIGTGAYFGYRTVTRDAKQVAAPPNPLPSVTVEQSEPAELPSNQPTAASVLDSEKTDPKKLTVKEAFAKQRVTVGGRAYTRAKVDITGKCQKVAIGSFGKALKQQRCSRVLRATYVDAKHHYAVTTGIAVFPTREAAVAADKKKNLAKTVWFRGLAGAAGSGADKADISGGYAAGLVWGRYIVFSFATYSDGHTPTAQEKDLGPVSGAFRDYTAEVIEKRVTK